MWICTMNIEIPIGSFNQVGLLQSLHSDWLDEEGFPDFPNTSSHVHPTLANKKN